MKIGIIVAMEKELEMLKEHAPGNAVVALSGIGKVNAAVAACRMIWEHKPDLVISIGVSGSMKKHVRQGDILVGDSIAYHDVWCGEGNVMGKVDGLPQFFLPEPEVTSRLKDLLPCHHGLLVCGDQFYISQEEDRRILSLYPDALAADMESGAIAQTCTIMGVPFAAVRIVSDTHDDDETQEESYRDFWTCHHNAFRTIMGALEEAL